MTPAQFAALMLPYARQVQAATGIDAWAVVTQWALETGSGSSEAFTAGHNPAGLETRNVKLDAYVLNTYPSIQAGVTDYIAYLQNGNYANVLATAGQPVTATLYALGKSPWSSSHYGNPPGQNLVNLWTGTYAAIAGQPVTTADPTSLFLATWQAAIALEQATGTSYLPAPWAAAQKLTGEHLGTVPSLADGANYVATMLQDVAIHVAGGKPVTGVSGVPAGATDPATVWAAPYVGLVHAAEQLGTDILGAPWAAAQGLTGHQLGHPPDLDAGASYVSGQVAGLVRFVTGNLYVVPTPPPGGTPTPPPSGGGTATGGGGVPLPPPPPSTGSGQAGLEAAWQALQTLLLQTVPAAMARVDAAIGSGGSSTPTIPHGQ